MNLERLSKCALFSLAVVSGDCASPALVSAPGDWSFLSSYLSGATKWSTTDGIARITTTGRRIRIDVFENVTIYPEGKRNLSQEPTAVIEGRMSHNGAIVGTQTVMH